MSSCSSFHDLRARFRLSDDSASSHRALVRVSLECRQRVGRGLAGIAALPAPRGLRAIVGICHLRTFGVPTAAGRE